MNDILSARIGKKCIVARATNGQLGVHVLGDVLKNSMLVASMEAEQNPVSAADILKSEMNAPTIPVQITFIPVELAIFEVLRNSPQNMFMDMPSPRTDTFFVVADFHKTQENFVRDRFADPRNLEMSIFYPGNTLVLSHLRYRHLCGPKALKAINPINLIEIKAAALAKSASVVYDCSLGIETEQLVSSGVITGTVPTKYVADCLCVCTRSVSQMKGIMFHINHAAINKKPAFRKFVSELK